MVRNILPPSRKLLFREFYISNSYPCARELPSKLFQERCKENESRMNGYKTFQDYIKIELELNKFVSKDETITEADVDRAVELLEIYFLRM